jgi:hypothetical protein
MDNTKIDILNIETGKLISIAEKIIQKHGELGSESPLQQVVIADLNARISHARQKHDEVMKYERLMEEARVLRDHYLGVKDKSVQLTLTAIINILKKENRDLSTWIEQF